MQETLIYKDLMPDLKDIFLSRPDLLPEGVSLNDVDIIGGAMKLPLYSKTELFDWEVTFRGYLGNPEWVKNYDLVFEGLSIVALRESITMEHSAKNSR